VIVSRTNQRARWILVFCAGVSLSLFTARAGHADDSACIASSEQALEFRKQGRFHDALKQLALCADPRCPTEVSSECTQRIAGLNTAMPTLILAARDAMGNDLYDVKVTMDDAPLLTSLDGRSIAIDPGEHSFHFEAPGQPPLDKKIVLRESEKDRRESVVIGTIPPKAPTPAAAPAGSSWSTQRTLAVIGVGVGVVGLASGAIFGGLTIKEKNAETSGCGTSSCYPTAKDHYDNAITDGTVSTVAFIAGGVFVITGAVLWVTSPAPSPASSSTTTGRIRLAPALGTRSGGALLQGWF
jgi:hypothetical protein